MAMPIFRNISEVDTEIARIQKLLQDENDYSHKQKLDVYIYDLKVKRSEIQNNSTGPNQNPNAPNPMLNSPNQYTDSNFLSSSDLTNVVTPNIYNNTGQSTFSNNNANFMQQVNENAQNPKFIEQKDTQASDNRKTYTSVQQQDKAPESEYDSKGVKDMPFAEEIISEKNSNYDFEDENS